MGTREVYEEKLRTGNLHHDPTMNPGLGSARCPRCLSLINPSSEKGEWTITSVLHDATAVAGSGIGGMLGAVHGFNTDRHDATRPINSYRSDKHFYPGIPFVQQKVKGAKWMQLLIGLPPLLLFSGVCAAFGGYALPKFSQLSVTSYYAASSASHYAISQITRRIEESYSHKSQ